MTEIMALAKRPLPAVETERKRIVARLERDGWIHRAGDSDDAPDDARNPAHDVYTHPAQPRARLVVLRRRVLTAAVARIIAKQAGWI
jgi:hypothetical protein